MLLKRVCVRLPRLPCRQMYTKLYSMHVAKEIHQKFQPTALLELVHPITWFPPMWAYLCGAISSGQPLGQNLPLLVTGLILAGPIVCGMSQAANDWCDRHVDAINEPDRPIPSGRIPGRMGLYVALAMTCLAFGVGALLTPWGFAATCLGVLGAWVYSAEPVRLKRSWLWGPGIVALCYEGLPWITGAIVMAGSLPRWEILVIALLYAAGGFGIMTLNDFKALDGDRQTGVRSLPVVVGPAAAAMIACFVMVLAQLLVIALLLLWGKPEYSIFITLLVAAQVWAMQRLMRAPKERAPWFNGTGVVFYVTGMMIAAFALRSMGAG